MLINIYYLINLLEKFQLLMLPVNKTYKTTTSCLKIILQAENKLPNFIGWCSNSKVNSIIVGGSTRAKNKISPLVDRTHHISDTAPVIVLYHSPYSQDCLLVVITDSWVDVVQWLWGVGFTIGSREVNGNLQETTKWQIKLIDKWFIVSNWPILRYNRLSYKLSKQKYIQCNIQYIEYHIINKVTWSTWSIVWRNICKVR